VAVGVLFVFALTLRLYGIGDENLWMDEVYQLRVASQSVLEIIRNYYPGCPYGVCDQAPLSFLVFHFFASPSEATFRLPAALCGAAGVVALLAVARMLVPAPVAWLGAVLLAFSPLHLWYSQEARWYTLWSLLVTLSYGMLVRALTSGRWRAWVVYGFVTAASAYTFIFTYFVIVCQGVSVLLVPPRARRLRGFIAAQLGVAVATLPVLLTTLGWLGMKTGTPRPTSLAAIPYTGFAYSVGFSLGPSLDELHLFPGTARILLDHPVVILVGGIFGPLVAWGVCRIWRDRFAAAIFLPWAFGLPLLVFLVSLVSKVTYNVRYSFASLPAFWVVLAAGVIALAVTRLRVAAVGAVVGCLVASLAGFFRDPRYDRPDVRGALTSVRTSAAPPGLVLLVGQSFEAPVHYAERLGVRARDGCVLDGDGDPVLWVLAVRDWEQAGPACLARLAPRYALAVQQRFAGVTLSRLTRVGDAS
jgi:hypothetical protein